MKKLYRNISIISSFLILSTNALAQSPKAVVEKIKGSSFVTRNGKTEQIHAGDYLYDFDEVFTEVGSQISFSDYYDHKFHLSGSGYVSILNKMIELKGGYLWVQTTTPNSENFTIQTINATASYSKGEFIISYDQDSGKSQLLSIKETHLFSNVQYNYLKEEVSAGKFSFINEKYENGAPRVPTPIGSSAYSAVTSLYSGVTPMEERRNLVEDIAKVQPTAIQAKSRTIASVAKDENTDVGTVIILKKEVDESRDEKLKSYLKDKMATMQKSLVKKPRKFSPDLKSKSSVSIKVYKVGNSHNRMPASVIEVKKASAARKPASMMDLNPQVQIKNDAFEKSLIQQYKNQMRHTKEVNSLINELKSYDQDYKQSY